MVGRSKIWQLSQFTDASRKVVQCSLCPTRIKFVGNTTNIARHLEIKHPLEFAALDPYRQSAATVSALARHKHMQNEIVQHKEESAICRILEQHRQELLKQHSGPPGAERLPMPPSPGSIIGTTASTDTSRSPITDWSWHVPVKGVSSIEDRMSSGEGGIGGGMVEELQTAVSPEAVLGTASAPEPQDRDPTPQPTTPLPPPKPESYQLRHNNHLTIVLEALAQDESFMDVTLTAQGRSLKAHKSVLSAVSPYFRGVLRENPCQHPIIIMPRDVRYEELYSIVNYIYKGEMTVAADDLTSLLKTAELLQVSGLAPSNSPSTSVNPNMVNPLIPGPRQRSGSNSSLGSPAATLKYRTSVAHPTNDRTQHYHGINPADFMDVDMTCVKEEVASGDEDESRDVRPVNVPSFVSNTTAVSATKESERHERSRHNSSDITPSTDNLNKNSPQTSARSNSPTSNTSSLKPDPDEQLFLASNPNSNLSINSNSNSDDTSEEQAVLEPFICPHCREGHRGCDVMATHLRLKHPTKPSFLCMCGRVFLRQSIKQAHARICSVSIST